MIDLNQNPHLIAGHRYRHRWHRLALAGAFGVSIAAASLAAPALAQSGPHHEWGGSQRGGPEMRRGPTGPGPMRGGMMFGPGSIERMVDRLVRVTDASTDQRQRMNAIAQSAGADVMALRQRHLAGRQQLRDILAAPTIDRGKLEAVRVEQMKLADEASKRLIVAMADIAELLTPIQREELVRRMDRHHGRHAL